MCAGRLRVTVGRDPVSQYWLSYLFTQSTLKAPQRNVLFYLDELEGRAMSNARAMLTTDFPNASGRSSFPATPTTGIIHDLGNLIQIASSAISIVARDPIVQTGDLGLVIAGARTSLERAGALVRQTMSMAREQVSANETVSVKACLAELEALFRITWGHDIRLDVRASSALPVVQCNSLALQNAVLNLLFNAREAMPGGGVISLSAEAVSLDLGEWIEIRIADSGIGMCPDTIAQAFDPFFTTKCDGLGGVGLPTVRRFMDEVGGRVIIESEHGVGTTVTLQLPACPESTDTLPPSGMTECGACLRERAGKPVSKCRSACPLASRT